AAGAGSGAAEVWTGAEGGLERLIGVLARARLHFGNDTGAVHLAAAVGTATVTIFGGGTWPRFMPASDRAISLVHPLPCFGCGWDCAFGDAPCVKWIGAAEVRSALAVVLEAAAGPEGRAERGRVIELSSVGTETAAMMGRAAAVSRERSAAHRERERKLQEIAYLSREKDAEIRSLKVATDGKDAEIRSLKGATDEKDVEIRSLKDAADGKDAEIRSLKRATDQKDAEIAALARAAEERRLGMERNQGAAEERKVRLEELHRVCEDLKRTCDERLAAIEALTRRVRELEALAKPR
ncbi:MAG: glycosyltransferase family 9 protein, partial [Opitutaceae bacterium]